ncbi:MAG TPA: glycerate kinase, partial [Chthonomonadaceae bacterium]|nr:glycerate kinase [Chthonomonadaceae bacterium]
AKLALCRLVVTGEGHLDGQTVRGKVVAGVARRAKAVGAPVIALAGGIAPGAEARLREIGLTTALSLMEAPGAVEEAMRDGYRLLSLCSERMMRLLELAW